MSQRLTGRGRAAAMVVLCALFTVIDVASKALAPWLSRLQESRAVAWLFGAGAPMRSPSLWTLAGLLALLGWLFGEPRAGLVMFGIGISTNWADALDARMARMYDERYKQLPDFIAKFFTIKGASDSPQKQDYRTSSAGAFGDVPEFTGSVSYDDAYQGYDGIITPKEYASGYQLERKLFSDAMYGVIDSKPKGLSTSVQRTRQKHAAQLFNSGFNVDTTWNNFTENVALFSNSHTTTAPGVSTATGFDNLVTTAFSAVALAAIRIQMVGFRDDRGGRITIVPKLIIYPESIYDLVHEAIKGEGKPGGNTNDPNVHYGAWEMMEWLYLTDPNDYWVVDPVMMKDSLTWFDREPAEFAMVESFDELIGKWRVYTRYGHGHNDWRFGVGAQVS
mgnify:CR=1 FL=1